MSITILNKKIICIMPVWDEQNMIGLALASSSSFISEYIILIQKCTDKTLDIINYCKKIWNLNIKIIENNDKIRNRRKLAMEISKSYADYYIIQDGDEIFYENTKKVITTLINQNITFSTAPIVFLENDFKHTCNNKENIIMPCHPFFFKNMDDIYFPTFGDMPWYNPNLGVHIFKEFKNPLKFDCKIKNFRRNFLREVFTKWHDEINTCSIEEYALENHHSIKWYNENINQNEKNLETMIKVFEKEHKKNEFKWNLKYNENIYYKYPYIINFFIEKNKLKGIEVLQDLKFLEELNRN